jgi:tetratricopeptide (TPR) repeat protein
MNERRALGSIPIFSVVLFLIAAIAQPGSAQQNRGNEIYKSGLANLAEGKYEEALDTFLRLKNSRYGKTTPSEYQVQIGLARAHLGLKKFGEAWSDLELAREQNNKSSEVYLYRGLYYFQQEKYREANKELDAAIGLNKHESYAYYYAGLSHYHLGEPARAVEDLKVFVGLMPDAPETDEATALIKKLC